MLLVATNVVILFAIIFLGFFLGKLNVIRKEAAPDYSNLVLNVTMPATAFLAAMSQPQMEGMLAHIGGSLLASIIYHLGACIFGVLMVCLFRVRKEDRGVWCYSCAFSNNGYMGLPLALAIFGSFGMFTLALANSIMNFMIFTIGIKFMTQGVEGVKRPSLIKQLLNPTNVAVVAGLILYLSGVALPQQGITFCSYLANITSGLSMFVVGLSLSRFAIKTVIADKKMFILVALRLVVIPFMTLLVFKILPFDVDPTIKGVIILTAVLPSSAAQSMLAEQYDANKEAAGRSVFLTTLFSVITVPIMMGFVV